MARFQLAAGETLSRIKFQILRVAIYFDCDCLCGIACVITPPPRHVYLQYMLLSAACIGDKTFITDKLCQLYIVYERLSARDRGSDRSAQRRLISKTSSEAFVRSLSALSDNWVSKTA